MFCLSDNYTREYSNRFLPPLRFVGGLRTKVDDCQMTRYDRVIGADRFSCGQLVELHRVLVVFQGLLNCVLDPRGLAMIAGIEPCDVLLEVFLLLPRLLKPFLVAFFRGVDCLDFGLQLQLHLLQLLPCSLLSPLGVKF